MVIRLFKTYSLSSGSFLVGDVNDTANCVKNMKLAVVVSFKTLIKNSVGATILDHVIDGVSSLYKWNFLPTKYVIWYTAGKQTLCWLIFAQESYPESLWFLNYSLSNIIRLRHHSADKLGKFQTYYCRHFYCRTMPFYYKFESCRPSNMMYWSHCFCLK